MMFNELNLARQQAVSMILKRWAANANSNFRVVLLLQVSFEAKEEKPTPTVEFFN